MKYCSILILLVFLISCSEKDQNLFPIDASSIETHLQELSSDKYQGRMPCSYGEELTVHYLVKELQRLGLEGITTGDYIQDVPLLTIDGTSSDHMYFSWDNSAMRLNKGRDFVIQTQRKAETVNLEDSELVFCGYGIVDERLGWNDYEGIDMKGKTAVVLVNDPGYGSDDPDFFKGDIMTYYGRWTYKYEEADRQGADGLLLIHETSSAGYPWFVVQSSWSGPQQGLAGIDRSNDCAVKGWIHLDKAVEMFEYSGLDFTEEIKKARKPGFKPVPLNAKVQQTSISNEYKNCISKNVLGYIKGSKYPDEYVIYTAHWDHIGIGAPVEGDSIYNGALDNASGTAALLAIAESFVRSETKPERSVVFLFVTAEEQGLLGSEYYAKNPVFPLDQTVCNLNIDGVNPAGLMKDFTITGIGHSEMDEYAKLFAEKEGRYVAAESQPEKGYFFRSDHFNFAKAGVPALYAEGGNDHAEKGKEYAKEFKDDFVAKRYHAPSDEYDPETWRLDGMVQDAQIYFNIGFELANNQDWPQWYEGSEFQRKESLKK